MTGREEREYGSKIKRAVRRIVRARSGKPINWEGVSQKPGEIIGKFGRRERAVFDQMILRNLRLVISIAKKFNYPFFTLDDLVQSGVNGLMIAVLRYDPSKQTRFSTYAVHWIRHTIQRECQDRANTIRLPVHFSEKQTCLRRLAAGMEQKLGRYPDMEELAQKTGLSAGRVNELLTTQPQILSLNAKVDNEDNGSVAELQDMVTADESKGVYGHEDSMAVAIDGKRAWQAMDKALTPKERLVLRMRFFDEMALKDIGASEAFRAVEKKGRPVCRERVRQIESEALEKLRFSLGIEQV